MLTCHYSNPVTKKPKNLIDISNEKEKRKNAYAYTRAREGSGDGMVDERDIERVFVETGRRAGALVLKFTSPQYAGVPDRIVLRDGKASFVELKAPGRRPRPLQRAMFDVFARHGFPVDVIDNLKDAREWWSR